MRPELHRAITTASCFLLFANLSLVDAQINESAPAASPAPAPQAPPVSAAAKDTAQTAAQDSLPPIDSMPRLLEFINAEYPPDLVKKGVEGAVVLDLVVDTLGRVDSVAIVKGFYPRLDSNAAAAARRFNFTPAKASGRAVPVIMEYVYRFSVQDVTEKIEQYVNLKGRLLERGTRAPVRDATVIVSFKDTLADTALGVPFGAYLKKICRFGSQHCEENAVVTITDSLGRFAFHSLPCGPITFKVICPGYEQLVENEVIKRGEAKEITYHIQRFSYSEYEIVVYGKAEKKEVAKYTLTLNEVRKVPGLGGDAVKVVQALPGVARSAFGSGAIIVRGSGSGDTRYLLDGVSLPLLFHFGGLKSTYNSDALATIDLYPGGWGTRYGGALGGVVEIKGREPKTDRVHGYLDGNLFDASVFLEGPITKDLSFLLTLRRSYIANVISFVVKDVLHYNLFMTAVPFYWDYIGRMDYKPDKNQHFYLTLFGSKDKLDLITSQVRGGSTEIDAATNSLTSEQYFHMGILGWDWTLSPLWKNELRYSLTKFSGGIAAFGFFKMQGDELSHYFRDQLSYSPNDRFSLNGGVDAFIEPYDLTLIIPGAENRIVKDTSHYTFGPIGAYVNAEWRPLKKLLLIPGIRYDYYPELRHYRGSTIPEFWNYNMSNSQPTSGEPSVRLSAKYELVKNHLIKGSLGTYNQTPQPQGQAIDKMWGTPDLPAEKGSQYVVGHEWQITDLIHSDVQFYYNQQWDNARSANAADIAANPSNLQKYYSDGKARMWGMELMLRHDQGKQFFGWLAYSLSRSERYDYMEKKWDLFGKDETHNIQLVGSFRFAGNRELGARIRYVTGDPTTPVLGVKWFDATNRQYVPQYGPRNSARMDPFFAIDMRYERKFIFKSWIWDIYLDVVNLSNLFGYGFKSPELGSYIWNYDYTEKQFISDVTRPALGISLQF
jgi:TonB family protein